MNLNLFISHVPYGSLYGAGTSLRYLLTGLTSRHPESRFILLSQSWRSPFKFYSKSHLLALPSFFPLFRSYEGYQPSFLASILLLLIDIFSIFPSSLYIFFVPFVRPRLIHLNSIVLSHLLPILRFLTGQSFICIHIREIPSAKYSFIYCFFWSFADSLICIDVSTKNRVLSFLSNSPFTIPNTHLLYNPVVFSVHNPSLDTFGVKSRVKYPYVFCFVGRLSPEKNIDFIVDSFLRSSPADAILLFVGSGSLSYLNSLKLRASACDNIFFLPSIPNLSETGFYNCIDCLIRCDPVLSVGRTVLESLIHSRAVLLRGLPSQLDPAFLHSPISPLFFFYDDTALSLSHVFSYVRPPRIILGDAEISRSPISIPSTYADKFSAICSISRTLD